MSINANHLKKFHHLHFW